MNRPVPGPGLVPVPTSGICLTPVAPELISAHASVVSGPDDVPVTGDPAVDAAMGDLRSLLSGERAGEDVIVLTGVHEALTRRLGDASR